MQTHDVFVIGAGLAGLRCAVELAARGREVVVLEAADRVGGRQRTDRVDDFTLDRGFHVLNTAYPAVRASVDVDRLGVRAFPTAVRVRRTDGTMATLGHPLRHPNLVPATLASGFVTRRDLAGLLRWLGPIALRPGVAVTRPDGTIGKGWDAAGLTGPLRTEVLSPFFSGILADASESTSNTYVRLLARSFLPAGAGLPRDGIGALPRALASRARAAGADIRVGRAVSRLRRRENRWEVRALGEGRLLARDVVVAVGAESLDVLMDVPVPATRGLQTWWFAAEEPPVSAIITVDGTREGPIVNSLAISATIPEAAPRGRHLIQATCLWAPDRAAPEPEVRAQLTRLWGRASASWELLRRDDIPHALPALPPPMRRPSPARIGDGLHIAGDHRETPSIQGALLSGMRAARSVLEGG
ncbi:FAD-dependent oxidoreductase [Microbacterium sp. 4R-513]|uniref:FAD-dependent oxidoreductase n=1 Tax=Microbacterium sp. 4R-513 TaxID=2567934 RepID=UPI0013E15ED0|nr:FAD-dependent oxidoreductase [Microbacterium sp. 4R-513]QIG39467.1 FAD-dependent oxidoreductase [Microbacterium sp. 4R-513]